MGKSHVGLRAGVDRPESLLRQWPQKAVPHGEGFSVWGIGAQEVGVLTLSIKQHAFHFHYRPLKTCVA